MAFIRNGGSSYNIVNNGFLQSCLQIKFNLHFVGKTTNLLEHSSHRCLIKIKCSRCSSETSLVDCNIGSRSHFDVLRFHSNWMTSAVFVLCKSASCIMELNKKNLMAPPRWWFLETLTRNSFRMCSKLGPPDEQKQVQQYNFSPVF